MALTCLGLPRAQALRRQSRDGICPAIMPLGRGVKPMARIAAVGGRFDRALVFFLHLAGLEPCLRCRLLGFGFHGGFRNILAWGPSECSADLGICGANFDPRGRRGFICRPAVAQMTPWFGDGNGRRYFADLSVER